MASKSIIKKRGSRTTVALKVLMAFTGLIFVGFLLFHMYGNLKLLMGAEAYDHYAEWLQQDFLYPILPHRGFLMIMRLALTLCMAGHVYSAATLWKRAKRARGSAYKVRRGTKIKASQTYTTFVMRWGGVLILIWIIFHILQFTALKLSVGADSYAVMTPYERVVAAFNVPWLWAFYLLAMSAIAFHIRHGVWSALATLGLSSRTRERVFKAIAALVALAILVGFMLPPTMILFGLIS